MYKSIQFQPIVTRYFGGTLLGTGGLVKAYGGSAKLVLEKAEGEFEELVEKKPFSFSVSYQLYESVKRYLATLHTYGLEENFEMDIELRGEIRSDEADALASKVFDMTKGKNSVTIGGDS